MSSILIALIGAGFGIIALITVIAITRIKERKHMEGSGFNEDEHF
jgi:hypothetical protein